MLAQEREQLSSSRHAFRHSFFGLAQPDSRFPQQRCHSCSPTSNFPAGEDRITVRLSGPREGPLVIGALARAS